MSDSSKAKLSKTVDFTTISNIETATGYAKGDSEDVLIEVDATSGKFAQPADKNRVQINASTILKIPVSKDSVVTIKGYDSSSVNYTMNGINAYNKEASYTASSAGYFELKAFANTYFNEIVVTDLLATDSHDSLAAISGASITNLVLNKTSTTLSLGENATLTATVTPNNSARSEKVVWTTSDAEKVSIEVNDELKCKVTALAVTGDTPVRITARANDTVVVTCEVSVSAKSVNTVKYLDLSKTFTLNGSDSGEIMTMSALTAGTTHNTTLTDPSKYESSSYAQWVAGSNTNTVSKETDAFWVSFDITPKETVKLTKISVYSANGQTSDIRTVVTVGNSVVATQTAANKISEITDAVIDSVISGKTTVKIAFQGTNDIKKEIKYRLANIVLSYENID